VKIRLFKIPYGIDWSLYILPIILSVMGIAIIFSITYGTTVSLAISQGVYLILGIAIAIGLTILDYRTLKGLYLILYIIGIALLVTVLFIGTKTYGASRWINLYVFQLQPSEIFKLIILITLSKLFADWENFDLKKILLSIILVLIPVFLIFKQPDLGTATVIIVGFLTILFLSPIRKIYLIIGLAVILAFSPLAWHFLKPYQKSRITAFLNPTTDPHGAGYNVAQAKIAVGSGGLMGQGLGEGSQSQLNFLPVAHTDFIFAGTAEAIGFVGSTFLIIVFILMVIRVFNVAIIAKDNFGMYLASGIGMMFLFQALVNIGMNLGIMPVTGIPLPFVSSGGSSMFTSFAAIGILQSIYRHHRKITF
jgi:rod shape determining protein RodA